MKKALIITVLTTVSLGLIGCGAANTANRNAMNGIITTVSTSAPSDAAPVKTETAAVSDEAAVPIKNSISTDTDNAADWKTAYKKTITEFMDSDNYGEMSTWDIQDIDNDGTPELLISAAQQHITGVMFYYYENGNAVPVLDDNRNPLRYGVYGGVLICPEESLIGITDIKQGLNYSVMHKYDNHRITFVQRTLEDSGAVGKENVTYTVNDDTVSEDEYNSALNEFSSKNWTAVGNQYTFDDLSALD